MDNNKDKQTEQNKRFYYLKMRFDFFERPEIMMIMSMEHGPAIITLFIQMIGKAANRSGYLKFSDSEPYTADIISIVFRTTKEVATAALVALQRFHLIDILDDKTIVILNINDFVGSETVWAEKKRQQRDKKGTKKGQPKDNEGTMSPNCPIEIDIEKDIEKEIEIEIENDDDDLHDLDIVTPAREEVIQFCEKNCPFIDPVGFFNYYDKREWTIKGERVEDWRSLASAWNDNMKRDMDQADRMTTEEQAKLFSDYKKMFGESVPVEYFGKPKYIKLAIATETPLKAGQFV